MRLTICVVLLFGVIGCGRAPTLAEARAFEQAGKHYVAAEYAQSAALYDALAAGGLESGALLFNLGNARLQAGERGAAIAAYRRAQRLRPRDPYLRANLEAALGRPDEVARPAWQHVLFWHRWLAPRTRWLWLGLLATLACGCGLLALWRRFWRWPARIALIAAVLVGASALLGSSLTPAGRHGVVVAERVVARKGNAESFAAAFNEALTEGTEFTVLETRNDWLRVRLRGTRLEGWLPAATVARY